MAQNSQAREYHRPPATIYERYAGTFEKRTMTPLYSFTLIDLCFNELFNLMNDLSQGRMWAEGNILREKHQSNLTNQSEEREKVCDEIHFYILLLFLFPF